VLDREDPVVRFKLEILERGLEPRNQESRLAEPHVDYRQGESTPAVVGSNLRTRSSTFRGAPAGAAADARALRGGMVR
jgi:hypothetical protein